MHELIETIHRWHISKELYDDEVIGHGRPGFRRRWTGTESSDGTIRSEDILQYEDFRHILHKWHVRLHKVCCCLGIYFKDLISHEDDLILIHYFS
jgi:THO complex subunit 2